MQWTGRPQLDGMASSAPAVVGLVTGALAAVLGGGSCSTTTGCAADSTGVYVCDGYAGAIPYDYAYVDPLYAGPGGYYPYTVDTYYDPLGYDTLIYNPLSAGPTPVADPTNGSDVPELLGKAQRAANAVNGGVRAALGPIKELITTAPRPDGDSVVYGPAQHRAADYQFTMRRLSESERHFGWTLEARPVNSSGSFAQVAGGLIRVGDMPRRGRGAVGVDCGAMAAADSAVTCGGTLLIGFAHTDAGDKILNVGLRGYTPDANVTAPLDAAVFAWRDGDDANKVRLVARTNLSGTASPAPETIAIKLAWLRDVGVRADAAATGGDIPPGQVVIVNTCVGADLYRGRAMTTTRTCGSDGTDCTAASDAATLTCTGGLTAEEPAPDATASDPPAGMPEMPEAPATMPDGAGG